MKGSELAIPGADTIIAPATRPDAKSPTRAIPRDFIVERPFADGLVGS
jgi:hypothetical protein